MVIGENGATTITSDEKGHAVSIAIPYGTYVVVESKTPHNMKTIKPFEVKIKENHPTEPQTWRVFLDREFTAKLRVIKKDSDTKQTVLVPNAEFKIFNIDKNEYVKQYTTYPSKVEHTSFFTDDDGDLILPEALKIGNYRIEEVSAPYGYVVNDKYVSISVDTDTAFETDGDTNDAIITVEYSDAPAVGELTVEKKGEVLDGFKGGLLASSYEKEFVYKEGSLAGAKFKVYAAEDIYTADNQKDADGNRIKYYSKGDLVTTLTTGKDGKATVKNLPLGQYRVVEVEAPYGYVLNPNEQKVTFTYVDDKTPVIKESLTFSDDRQKLDMSVTKLDAEDNTPIAGAVFGLYADEDIKNEEVIRELLELLKKNAMKEQANDVFEICSYVDGLEKKIDSMTEELTNMQNQIKEMQEDTLVNNVKKALAEARERLNTRCEQIKSQVSEVKAQVKSTAKSIVDEAKAKGRAALYRVSEFLGIKKRLLDIRENVRGAIKTTDKDIAKTALLAKGFREAGQTVANAFRTFADKPEVDYSRKEQKHPITKAVLAPMKAVKKILVSMELHLDASINKLDNLAMNVQLDKEEHMENVKEQEQTEPERAETERVEAEIVYSPMVAEPQEYQYNADAFEARCI